MSRKIEETRQPVSWKVIMSEQYADEQCTLTNSAAADGNGCQQTWLEIWPEKKTSKARFIPSLIPSWRLDFGEMLEWKGTQEHEYL